MNKPLRDQLGDAGDNPDGGGSNEIPAATVVLGRDSDDGIEILLMRRNSSIAFGGAWVFPGGKVEPEDEVDTSDDLEAARIAGVRETQEEAGLALDPAALQVWSHWRPPPGVPKRFSTWFFVAEATDEPVRIDNGEITDHEWMTPATALERHVERDIELAPPTWITLHDVGAFSTVAELLANSPTRQDAPAYATRIGRLDDDPVALWEPDAGWVDADVSLPGPRNRLIMRRGGWVLERSGR